MPLSVNLSAEVINVGCQLVTFGVPEAPVSFVRWAWQSGLLAECVTRIENKRRVVFGCSLCVCVCVYCFCTSCGVVIHHHVAVPTCTLDLLYCTWACAQLWGKPIWLKFILIQVIILNMSLHVDFMISFITGGKALQYKSEHLFSSCFRNIEQRKYWCFYLQCNQTNKDNFKEWNH